MPNRLDLKHSKYNRRVKRVRAKVVGTPERPRLSVCKSLKHIYAQVIDDTAGNTLVFASSLSKEARDKFEDKDKKTDKSFKVGQLIAEMAKARGIENVVFDRQGSRYHGRIKAVAEGARKSGLNF
ncbi:MAG: 50S ribosomal protein L18 [candidate division Zixibacteria bacterium]|jgi:large subunit ribosomal protein L18|nr:50S ribosomal protein L18 [candidate division Zixibacteria bacterium]NIR67704.1 50S ribosomal protein L18 [candidate division Zixibacteria bacterium]NIS16770.1 50S ribosomal protein L18 [candidate division Zixibacteria bacterium]NIS48957.1 50S ribosomal protein L18 [candidate division Zixibacteria bacterium]NIT53173.1 50S ribosomal protein L18 [candidate division Zixibacteria bacterium]